LTPSELRLDRDTLEENFDRVVEDAGVASIEELNRLLDRADKLKAVLKAPQRVDQTAATIRCTWEAWSGWPNRSSAGAGGALSLFP
jgi:hypothetical protein